MVCIDAGLQEMSLCIADEGPQEYATSHTDNNNNDQSVASS